MEEQMTMEFEKQEALNLEEIKGVEENQKVEVEQQIEERRR